MKIRKIPMTPRQVSQLMARFRVLKATIGPHLSDEELIRYTMQTLEPSALERVATHLEACQACTSEAERLLKASSTWRGTVGERRLAALREQLLGEEKKERQPPSLSGGLAQWLQQMAASWQATFQVQQPLVADSEGKRRRRIWQYQSPDGHLRGYAVLDQRGDVTFRITCKEMALLERTVQLRWGECRRDIQFQQVSATEIGAKIVVLSHECPDEWAEIALDVVE